MRVLTAGNPRRPCFSRKERCRGASVPPFHHRDLQGQGRQAHRQGGHGHAQGHGGSGRYDTRFGIPCEGKVKHGALANRATVSTRKKSFLLRVLGFADLLWRLLRVAA